MTVPLALSDVKDLLVAGKKLGLETLYLSGGEPFAYPNFLDVVKFAKELNLSQVIIYTSGATLGTNGEVKPLEVTDISEIVSVEIPIRFTVSLNSYDEAVHDTVTKTEGSWKNAVSFLRRAVEMELDVHVHTVLNRMNYAHINELRKFLKEQGKSKPIELRLLMLVPQGRASAVSTYNKIALRQRDWSAVKPHIELESGQLCPVRLGAHLGQNLHHKYVCGLDQPKLLIEPDGSVSVCPALKGTKKYIIAPNIKDKTLDKIITSAWRKNLSAARMPSQCLAQIAYDKPLEFLERDDKVRITDKLLLDCFSEHIQLLGYCEQKESKLRTQVSTIIARLDELHQLDEINCLFQYFAKSVSEKGMTKLSDIRKEALIGAIHVLKFNDLRENSERHTTGAGKADTTFVDLPKVEELEKYIRASSNFERVLYGADTWYRDHDVHAFRVWLLGLYILWSNLDNKIVPPPTSGSTDTDSNLYNNEELLAIFTIAALTHDIGYPLEKLSQLNIELQKILESFGGLAWRGVHSEYTLARHDAATNLIRHLRSKPVFKEFTGRDISENDLGVKIGHTIDSYKLADVEQRNKYDNSVKWGAVLRSQTKYYDKYVDSLEKNDHGLLSALLLQRKLTYFKEGEFAFEEDYFFTLEEARQFLIRREILRATATHTCSEIYLNNLLGLEAFLFFCDEMQEWGRPYFKDLYETSGGWRNKSLWLEKYSSDLVSWEILLGELSFPSAARRMLNIGQGLANRLRTGPETGNRKFKVKVRNSWSCNGTILFYDFEADFSLKPRRVTAEIKAKGKTDCVPMDKYIDEFNAGNDYEKICEDLTKCLTEQFGKDSAE